MNRNVAWAAITVVLTAGIHAGVTHLSEALVLDYRMPPSMVQEVANVALAKYARQVSWEDARYTLYIASSDKRIDLDRLIREAPPLPKVTYFKCPEGESPVLSQDYSKASLSRIVTIWSITGDWKRVHVAIGTYVSAIGITRTDFALARRWWGWSVVDVQSQAIARLFGKGPTRRQSQRPDRSRLVLLFPKLK